MLRNRGSDVGPKRDCMYTYDAVPDLGMVEMTRVP